MTIVYSLRTFAPEQACAKVLIRRSLFVDLSMRTFDTKVLIRRSKKSSYTIYVVLVQKKG